jgi:chromosome segregation ATPase
MQVSISKAADMVGITRATLYRHIEKKGITTVKDREGNPKIDVSELIRVYGDEVKMPGEEGGKNTENKENDTASETGAIQDDTPPKDQSRFDIMQEKVKRLEGELELLGKERIREREQLQDQIDSLNDHLKTAQDQANRVTALLTDQREREQGREDQLEAQSKIDELTRLVEMQLQDRKAQDERFRKLEGKLSEYKEKGESVLKKAKRLAEENTHLKQEIEKPFWKKWLSA